MQRLIETKGMESSEVSQKDAAAENWCENASALTGKIWRSEKFRKRDLKFCNPWHFADLAALR